MLGYWDNKRVVLESNTRSASNDVKGLSRLALRIYVRSQLHSLELLIEDSMAEEKFCVSIRFTLHGLTLCY